MLPFVARHHARQAKPDRVLAPHSKFAAFTSPAACRAARTNDTCAPNGVENELNRLAEKKILSTEQAHAVDKRKIERFFASDLYKTFMAENKVRREFKFSVLVPAQAYFPVAADAPEENVLLQGVIDCLIETRDGFVILDFKTDRIKKGGAVERAEQYRPQLAAYARAVHEIYGRPVRACVLYFFHTGDTEWVSLDED